MSEIVITSVSEFQNQISQLNPDESGLLYRGQADGVWPVNSSAVRRLTGHHVDEIEQELMSFPLVGYMNFLISKAKMRQFLSLGSNPNPPDHDLEILAQLQHFGAATVLIDFTRQPSVALWFACNRSRDKDGAVYILSGSKTMELNLEDFKENLESLYEDDRLWSWEPAPNENRIIAQSSVFVLGGSKIESRDMTKITIRSVCKHQILTQLETMYGINEEMLNPDFPGYAVANGTENSLDLKRTVSYWYNQINQEICNNKKATAYYKCGMAYRAVRHFKDAAHQFSKAIGLDSEFAAAYYNRGIAYAGLEQHVEAITDFNKAICFNPNSADSYFNRGISNACLGQHESAIVDFNFTIAFQPTHPLANTELINAFSSLGQVLADSTILMYNSSGRHELLEDWLSDLTDRASRSNFYASIDRLRSGNYRNRRELSNGLFQLITHPDSRYRSYFYILENGSILLLKGGIGETQFEDIRRAQSHLEEITATIDMNNGSASRFSTNYSEWIIQQLKGIEESRSYLKASVTMFEEDQDVLALMYTLRNVASALNHIQPAPVRPNTDTEISTETMFRILESFQSNWPKLIVLKLLEYINQFLPVALTHQRIRNDQPPK